MGVVKIMSKNCQKISWGLMLLSSVLVLETNAAPASQAALEFPTFRVGDYLKFEPRKTDPELFEELNKDEVDIPRLSERLYSEGEDARLPIDRVIVTGVTPHPEFGITPESIQALADKLLREEKATETDENGFSRRDLDDIGALIREMWDRGTEPDKEDMDKVFRMLEVQNIQRGWITLEQLDAVALGITEFYRDPKRGFILSTAFVPAQDVVVDDGVDTTIEIRVLEGRLGEVTVSNNEIFDDDTIRAAFNDEVGEAVTGDQVENALRRVNDLPGIRVRGSFSPGDKVGETSLNLGVLEERSWAASVLMDNHGADTTGENRIFASVEWLNIANKGHRVAIGALRSEGPDSTTYGLLEYELPVTKDGRGRVRASVSSNIFTVTRLAALPEITGETNSVSVLGSYQFLRGRTLNLNAQVGYVQKDVLFQVGDLETLSTDQKLETVSVAVDYTQLWDKQLLLLTGRFGIDQGHIISGELRDQSTDFTKVLLNANLLKRFSINNWLTKNRSSFNLVAKINSQYAVKFLSSVEQFSLGGPTAVRAFGVSDVSVDSGIYAGLELFFDLPLDPVKKFNLPLDPLRPFVFYDYAYGVAIGLAGGGNRDAEIKAYGFGLRINWPGRGIANLIFAKPQSAFYQNDFLDADGKSRIYFDVTFQIH